MNPLEKLSRWEDLHGRIEPAGTDVSTTTKKITCPFCDGRRWTGSENSQREKCNSERTDSKKIEMTEFGKVADRRR